jgi:hypothetical protein
MITRYNIYESIRDKMTGNQDKFEEWSRFSADEVIRRFEEHFGVKVSEYRVFKNYQLITFTIKTANLKNSDDVSDWFVKNTDYYIDSVSRSIPGEIFYGLNPKKKKVNESVRDKMTPVPIEEVKNKIKEDPRRYIAKYKNLFSKEEILDMVDKMGDSDKMHVVLFDIPEYFDDKDKKLMLDILPGDYKYEYILGRFNELFTEEELEKYWELFILSHFEKAYEKGKTDVNLDWIGRRWAKYTKRFEVSDMLYKYKDKFMTIQSIPSGNWYMNILKIVGNTNESIRDKMTPKSEEDIKEIVRGNNMSVNKKITFGLTNGFDWIVQQGLSEIPNLSDNHLKLLSVRFETSKLYPQYVKDAIQEEISKRGLEQGVSKWTPLDTIMLGEGLKDKMSPKSSEEIDRLLEPMYKRVARELVGLEQVFGCLGINTYEEAYDFILQNKDKVWRLVDEYGTTEPYKIALSIQHDYRIGRYKLDESVRDLMTPKSKKDIDAELEELEPFERLMAKLNQHSDDVFNRIESYYTQKEVDRMCEEFVETINFSHDVYDKIDALYRYLGLSDVISDELKRSLGVLSAQEQIQYVHDMQHLGQLYTDREWSEIQLRAKQERRVNESVRDLMTPKSSDEINNLTKDFSPNKKLEYGINHGFKQLVEMSIDEGADVNQRDMYGKTPLIWVTSKSVTSDDDIDIIKILLDNGADVNHKDSFGGQTALMFASYKGDFEIVELLLNSGADASIKNKNNQTAMDFAEIEDHRVVIYLLRRLGKVDESVRDLMTPKSKEEIRIATRELFLNHPVQYFMRFNSSYDELSEMFTEKEIRSSMYKYTESLFLLMARGSGDHEKQLRELKRIVWYLFKKDYLFDKVDGLNNLWFNHRTLTPYQGGSFSVNGYTKLDFTKNYITRLHQELH